MTARPLGPHKSRKHRGQAKALALVGVGTAIAYNGYLVAAQPELIPGTYGVRADGPDLTLLLQHRAVMLALIGSLLIASAFKPSLRAAAATSSVISIATYAALALTTEVNDDLRLVGLVDVVLLALLLVALFVPDGPSRTDHDVLGVDDNASLQDR